MFSLQFMLHVKHIQLVQFRNYLQQQWTFSERITGICGANGTGKTNILDAVYYLSMTRSYFSRADALNVTRGYQGMRIQGTFSLNDREQQIVCILRENNKKEFLLNDEPYRKLSQHIGRFPAVMITPDDTELIAGPGEGRRSFMDAIICQLSQVYLETLIRYSRLLQQRNSYLKQIADGVSADSALMDTMNEQLNEAGSFLFQERNSFCKEFIPLVNEHYARIAGEDDGIVLQYSSQLSEGTLLQLLQQSLRKDIAIQRTSCGVHRDDLSITMQGAAFKLQASQGQRKSLLFALKLAEWQVLEKHKGFAPILLLDDVFEKLDAKRMHNLLHWVCAENEGQVLITDTHRDRLVKQLEDIGRPFQIIELS